MFSLLTLFFLILPVLLMIWLVAAQRRMRGRESDEPQLPHGEPWEETVKIEGGLVCLKRFNPNTEMTDANGRVADAHAIQALGIGL